MSINQKVLVEQVELLKKLGFSGASFQDAWRGFRLLEYRSLFISEHELMQAQSVEDLKTLIIAKLTRWVDLSQARLKEDIERVKAGVSLINKYGNTPEELFKEEPKSE